MRAIQALNGRSVFPPKSKPAVFPNCLASQDSVHQYKYERPSAKTGSNFPFKFPKGVLNLQDNLLRRLYALRPQLKIKNEPKHLLTRVSVPKCG